MKINVIININSERLLQDKYIKYARAFPVYHRLVIVTLQIKFANAYCLKIEWPAHPALACIPSLSNLIYYLITEIILRPIVWETDFSCFTYVFYQMHLNTFENQFALFFVDFSIGWSGEFRREILGGNVKKEYNNLNKEMLIPGEAF